MKPLFFVALIVIAVGCETKICGCVEPDPQPLRMSAQFTNQTTDFAFESFKRINAAASNSDVFFSPMSLHMALGMVLNGANGTTKTEIERALRLNVQTTAEANQTYRGLIETLPRMGPQVNINLANSVWYRNGFTVAPTFETLLRDTFRAKSTGLDFASPLAPTTINQWASDNTNGLIPKMLDRIDPSEVMFLMNAIYFKGNWKTQFDAAKTIDAPFTLTNGSKKQVRMMRLETDLRRAFEATYTAFELPYGNDKIAMTVLLPGTSVTADALAQRLSLAEWTTLQSRMATGKIDIGLPKFSLKTEANLKAVLSDMGMPTAFTDRADFTGINPNGGLLLTQVKQNAFVTVDEKGTEAAAVTNIGVGVTSVPVPYLCDRPFLFVIHEKDSGSILFMGKVTNPVP